jgi:type IV pilus assembly protein PilN
MKIPINLASQPFRRDRAMFLASLGVSLLLVATLGALLYLARADRAERAEVSREVDRLRARVSAASANQSRLESVLRQPVNAQVVERSVFLNDLIYHKSISWSRLFSDLEQTVPGSVQILSLHPTVDNDNQVTLDMTVGAQSPLALIELLKALEESPRFGKVYNHSMLPPTQAEPLNRCRITVNYAQKL